jgi:polar amino acid transport system substrate-binding protein
MAWKHIRRWVALLPLIAIAVAACGGTTNTSNTGPADLLSLIKARGYIVLGTQTDDPPAAVLQPDGTFKGFNIEMGQAIAKDLGVRIEYVTPTWAVMTAGNWSKRWDLVVNGMTITGARQKVINYSKPYNFISAQFAASKASGITSVDQIAGKTVCVGSGTTYQLWLQGQLDLGTYNPKNSPPANSKVITNEIETVCAEAWKAGRNDAQAWLTASYTVDDAIKAGLPVVKVGVPAFQAPLAAATDKNGPDPASLLAEINKVIDGMRADGSLSAMCTKWFGFDSTKQLT